VSIVWIRHPETGGVAQVPESAVPIYRQSNWDVMSAADVAEMEKRLTREAADAEQAMADTSAPTPEPPAEADFGPSPAPRKPASKETS
jgi:hypothetical protein